METIEDLAREQKLAELEIARQVIADRNERIQDLERKVELLETMLNRTAAFGAGLPQPQPLPALRTVPRRWAVR